jgi:hypothetical protein
LKFSKNKKERRKKISSFGIEQIVCLEWQRICQGKSKFVDQSVMEPDVLAVKRVFFPSVVPPFLLH